MTAPVQGRDGTGAQSADRVLRVLGAIGSDPRGLTAAEIAATLGLTAATTYRLLKTLQLQGFVDRQHDHRYLLGRTVAVLGRAQRHQLVVTDGVRASLRQVHDLAHAAAYLTVFRGDEIVVAHILDSPEHPRIGQLHVGFTEAAHATAFGKLMLAAKDDDALDRYLERHPPRALTAHSVTDAGRLREQLALVRSRQVAVEVEEYSSKLACIAAPVRSRAGAVIGAVSVSVSAADFSRQSDDLARLVWRGAGQVSAQIS